MVFCLNFQLGQCVLQDKCKCPDKELRPEHERSDYNLIVPVLYGVFNEVSDKYICGCRDVNMKEVIINSSQVTGVILTIT